jgi:hypothetical protein
MTSLGEKTVVVPAECMLRIKHTGVLLDLWSLVISIFCNQK